mmetsp:Transcript_20009/g.50371  ORF Transcript_20009/g.50371 Transcript_20009/m.50371 type:complete len:454 (+) Transcript_20009:359-1720(+)
MPLRFTGCTLPTARPAAMHARAAPKMAKPEPLATLACVAARSAVGTRAPTGAADGCPPACKYRPEGVANASIGPRTSACTKTDGHAAATITASAAIAAAAATAAAAAADHHCGLSAVQESMGALPALPFEDEYDEYVAAMLAAGISEFMGYCDFVEAMEQQPVDVSADSVALLEDEAIADEEWFPLIFEVQATAGKFAAPVECYSIDDGDEDDYETDFFGEAEGMTMKEYVASTCIKKSKSFECSRSCTHACATVKVYDLDEKDSGERNTFTVHVYDLDEKDNGERNTFIDGMGSGTSGGPLPALVETEAEVAEEPSEEEEQQPADVSANSVALLEGGAVADDEWFPSIFGITEKCSPCKSGTKGWPATDKHSFCHGPVAKKKGVASFCTKKNMNFKGIHDAPLLAFEDGIFEVKPTAGDTHPGDDGSGNRVMELPPVVMATCAEHGNLCRAA